MVDIISKNFAGFHPKHLPLFPSRLSCLSSTPSPYLLIYPTRPPSAPSLVLRKERKKKENLSIAAGEEKQICNTFCLRLIHSFLNVVFPFLALFRSFFFLQAKSYWDFIKFWSIQKTTSFFYMPNAIATNHYHDYHQHHQN